MNEDILKKLINELTIFEEIENVLPYIVSRIGVIEYNAKSMKKDTGDLFYEHLFCVIPFDSNYIPVIERIIAIITTNEDFLDLPIYVSTMLHKYMNSISLENIHFENNQKNYS